MVGNASKMPWMPLTLQELMPGAARDHGIDPATAVAEGAALCAAMDAGVDVGCIVHNKVPSAIGIRAVGERDANNKRKLDVMSPLIKANMPMPSSGKDFFGVFAGEKNEHVKHGFVQQSLTLYEGMDACISKCRMIATIKYYDVHVDNKVSASVRRARASSPALRALSPVCGPCPPPAGLVCLSCLRASPPCLVSACLPPATSA